MKEKLYTIPVMDVFNMECDCPLCKLYDELEIEKIEFTMGESYMEDDVRMITDQLGFCDKHIKLLYKNQNRLGLALIMKTHMDRVISDVQKLSKNDAKAPKRLFTRGKEDNKLSTYLNTLHNSCYVCNLINKTYERYLVTICYLYKKEPEFKALFQHTKGLCTTHYNDLYEASLKELGGDILTSFHNDLNKIYLSSMEQTRDDLTWFIDKFDYRNAEKPWGTAKDALPRSIQKMNKVSSENL